MASDADVLWFRMSDGDLKAAIELLRPFNPLVTYNEAWQALILEHTRRELRSTPSQIRLTLGAYTGLPARVQALFERI